MDKLRTCLGVLALALIPALASAQNGAISGTVTGEGSGPINGMQVFVFDQAGVWVATGLTNASGLYTASDLPPGNYRLYTFEPAGQWVMEVYPNITCYVGCNDASPGQQVPVTASTTTSGIDFTLAVAGSIAGTVTDAMTTNPMALTQVRLSSGTGVDLTGTSVMPDGTYVMRGLPAGTYLVATEAPTGYLDEVYNDIPCGAVCQTATILTGTPIPVAANQDVTGIDFALSQGAQITGTVTNAGTGAPLSGYQVRLFGASGASIRSVNTTAAGLYTFNTLLSGTYYVGTNGGGGAFVNEIYNNVECFPSLCNSATIVAQGTPIVVTAPGTAANRDFALSPLGSITGMVRDESLNPAAGIPVRAVTPTASFVSQQALTSAGGVYTITGLKSGSYFVITEAQTGGWVNEVYDNIPCDASCDPTGPGFPFTPVAVTAPAPTPNINFTLTKTGSIAGVLTDQATGSRVRGVVVALSVASDYQKFAPTNNNGEYTLSGLPVDDYLLVASATGYFDEFYDNIRCLPGSCPIHLATPTTLVLGSTIVRNFALAKEGSISGTVTDAGTGAAISGAYVYVIDSAGQHVTSEFVSNGSYTVGDLTTGTYYLYTQNASDYLHEVPGTTFRAACRARPPRRWPSARPFSSPKGR